MVHRKTFFRLESSAQHSLQLGGRLISLLLRCNIVALLLVNAPECIYS
jgi:hypothetical protein